MSYCCMTDLLLIAVVIPGSGASHAWRRRNFPLCAGFSAFRRRRRAVQRRPRLDAPRPRWDSRRVAVKLHRCPTMWAKFGKHPCWHVQKALDEQGVDYEVVKG